MGRGGPDCHPRSDPPRRGAPSRWPSARSRRSSAPSSPPPPTTERALGLGARAGAGRHQQPSPRRTAAVHAPQPRSTWAASATLAGDVAEADAGAGVLVTVRRGKTNPEGEARDVRFVKGDVAGALRTLRDASSPGPEDRVVPLSPQMVGLRFQPSARAAGVEPVTAHSARVGLASELTRRGASTTDVMLAGNWKTSRMVAHYSSGATAERGAVAQYLLKTPPVSASSRRRLGRHRRRGVKRHPELTPRRHRKLTPRRNGVCC